MAPGANVNRRAPDGSTALLTAAHAGYLKVMRVLLDGGADVDMICTAPNGRE